MYITPSGYSQIFHDIKRTSLSHSTCKLVVFVSCLDIDSLCAAKIVSLLLRKELIQYQLIPVVGYSDLKGHYSKLDADVSNVILIGCGAMLDLETFFDINIDELAYDSESREGLTTLSIKIYVIDGHRPWNLDNVFGSSVVVCLDDGFVDSNLVDQKSAYDVLVEQDEEESEDEDEDEDEESASSAEIDISSNDEEISFNSQDSEDAISRKRKIQERRLKNLKKQRKLEKTIHEETIQSYYNQGTTIMTATTTIVYALLASIGETSLENLWLAIIGTSSLDNQYPEIYDKLQPLLKDEVLRLNPSNNSISNNNINEKTADSTSLSIERDYHLFLLRHWTLYDSFFYSSHVNSKLNLWREDGRKKLHKLFAKMGVSLASAQQKWLYMDVRIKRQLPFIFNKYLPIYGLEGVVREGFIRTFGYTGQLSAMECVEALTALLESDKRLLSGDRENTPISGDEDDSQDEQERIQDKIDRKEKAWINNFWSSWDALNMNPSTLLLQGLEQAKVIQQVIFKTGMSLLERKLVKNLRLYRLCVLNDGSIPDLSIFNNPLMLAKLGSWLLENLSELFLINSSQSLKPLVVASLDMATDTYLVIGMAPKYPRGMDNTTRAKLMQGQQDDQEKNGAPTLTTRLNTFSVAFQQLANTSGAKVRIDSFDSSVIEIRKDDLPPFLEKLTLSGLI
ncbi:DNA replication initiation [Scheffersomyces stipitis CBS 6054]|uniref:DNA replication initiation n=1 Tax=Scheffersomyces stipitis (strain ATCC 58785 / CBS 6054 / NBRC 10063 / NRRL Y-11545) TaxID=322104 RepID=A3LSK0_PICST|nr:DNA replication initiation [Scheffersomyces stipitis CBS 6054]ABN65583.2 DNA replication initiation [Scheffersomyces stipitis CBS 6054]